jgi:hypothetical protein
MNPKLYLFVIIFFYYLEEKKTTQCHEIDFEIKFYLII